MKHYDSLTSKASVGGSSRPVVDPTDAVQRATAYLLSLQEPEGHWVGEMEGDTILESEYIILWKILGNGDETRLKKAAEYIRRRQLPKGGWAIYNGGPRELSASVKAYYALKLTGTHPSEPEMQLARQAVLEMGGAGRCNSYTRFYLAALGQIPWSAAPAVPPEIMLLPNWFYFNLYAISSWSRTFVVPLSIIWAHKPVTKLGPNESIEELFVPGKPTWGDIGFFSWKRFFLGVDKMLKFGERCHILPWRKKGVKAAHEWVLDHFEKSSGLGAIFPPMIYALIALRCLGYPDDHPEVIRATEELEDLGIEDEETLKLQPCKSPVWDTAIIVNALTAAGMPAFRHELIKTGKWLLSKEVRCQGDWSIKRPGVQPGGWYFEYENEFYPDIDDTAMVLLALRHLPVKSSEAICRAIDWVLSMQNKDGGWASFDVDNNRQLFCSIPFADHNAMIDPSTADITGRVLEMLATYGYGRSHDQVQRAIEFILHEQEPDGSWFGRWGVNYIYGTFAVLRGLTAIGLPDSHPSIIRAAEWLLGCQHEDGGWGETCGTYDHPCEKGKGSSSSSQTAWAVMGLIAAGYGNSDAVKRGISFLLNKQNPDGSWDEDEWTGTGFPKVFYLKYHSYRQSFPLWALGVYAQHLKATGEGSERKQP